MLFWHCLSSFDLDLSFYSIERRTSSLPHSSSLFLTLSLLSPYSAESPEDALIKSVLSDSHDKTDDTALHPINSEKASDLKKFSSEDYENSAKEGLSKLQQY